MTRLCCKNEIYLIYFKMFQRIHTKEIIFKINRLIISTTKSSDIEANIVALCCGEPPAG
jgi:hypothetical protein